MEPAERVRRFVQRRIASGRMPAAAWWTGPAGREPSAAGAAGRLAGAGRAMPARRDTPWDLASLTKALATAPLLVLLEQDRHLRLDQPASRWLPGLGGGPHADTSLEALARHRGRLPAWRPLYTEARGIDEVVRVIGRIPPLPEAGAVYSDLGYILLGAVLERAAGGRLDALFAELIAGPAGLRRTGFATGPDRFADAAPTERGNAYERELAGRAGAGHAFREAIAPGQVHDANAWNLGGAAGHAGLFGPVDEVAALAGELLRPQRLGLSERARRRLLEPDPAGRTLGLVAASASAAARGILAADAPGHTGFTGTSFWLEPATGRVHVLLSNRVCPRVPAAGFHPVRRGFHRVACRLVQAPRPRRS